MSLKVTTKEKEPGVFIVSLKGSIDNETSANFERTLQKLMEAKAIILDMAGLTYISSIGLSLIFKTKKQLENNKAVLLITHLKPNVQKVFELVKVIPEYVFTTMEEADTYLDSFLSQIEEK